MKGAGEQIDILLVDDRPENLLALEAVLKNPDFNLVKVESGDDALRYLLEHEPALILLDVQMPNLDGFETASIIKQSARTRDIPIIFLTAINKDERYVHQGYRGGAVDYIAKPFDDEILRAKVNVFADLHRKSRRLLKAEQALHEADRVERERKLRELELASLLHDQVQQQKYRDLVADISHAIVWVAEPTTMSFSFVSESAESILGYPLEDWVTKNIFEECGEKMGQHSILKDAIAELTSGKKTEVLIEHCCLDFENKRRWFQTSMRLRRKAKSSVFELRGLSTDITKLKTTEDALRLSQAQSELMSEASYLFAQSIEVESLLKQIGNWVVPKLADWCFIDMVIENGALETASITHNNENEIRALQTTLLSRPVTMTSDFPVTEVVTKGESFLWKDDFASSLPAEFKPYFENRSAIMVPLKSRGVIIGALTLVGSLTDSKYNETDMKFAQLLASRIALTIDNAKLFKNANEAVQVRDEFLSVASHELRTPLTALTLQIQLLYRSLKNGATIDPDKMTEMAQGTNRQLKRLINLLDDLLDVTRISQGKLALNLERLELNGLIREVASRFDEALLKAKCSLTLDLSPNDIHGDWDPIRIEQVVSNLLTNAMKYGTGKPVRIRAERANGRARIFVEDKGVGISREDQKRIFDRFERAISAKEVSGLGLGLYIVSQILNAHKGNIQVTSEIGHGSTFTVDLPIGVETAPNMNEPAQRKATSSSSAQIH